MVNRNTGEAYWDHVKGLAAQSGIDPENSAAVRQFDRKRPKKMSNQEWENPDDPDARIGPKKDGATDMTYKPQSVVDLDTGATVGAEVLPGDVMWSAQSPEALQICGRILQLSQLMSKLFGVGSANNARRWVGALGSAYCTAGPEIIRPGNPMPGTQPAKPTISLLGCSWFRKWPCEPWPRKTRLIRQTVRRNTFVCNCRARREAPMHSQ